MAAKETKGQFAADDREAARAAGKALVLVSIEGRHLPGFAFRSYERLLRLTPEQTAKVVAFAEGLWMEAVAAPGA